MTTQEAMNWILAHRVEINICPSEFIEITVYNGSDSEYFGSPYGDPGRALIRLVTRAQAWLREVEVQVGD
jgi:hypothetical protein